MTFSKSQAARLRRERGRLLDELSRLPLLMRASLFERFSTCARPHCACHQGKRHGPRTYLAVTGAAKQRQHYVPNAQRPAARLGVSQFRRLEQIVERITQINLQLMKGDSLDDP